ncbi:hypothetical protein [Cyanobium sp. CH-040]|uniref:hypothetical protein n=1 Tax=Cyanobium sp. CH-040 TaxID=2823708 RepID=UPI0020CB8135|nr:hypothetical protein [Cyanobium sp. CH-040]MCP9926953.1 hypothetical protein [Cyanobium sp. CH-040]
MSAERTFRFRLQSRHAAPGSTCTDLAVQWLNPEGHWEPQELGLTMPGFRIYLISLLLCQHFYLVANARERDLHLERVTARFTVVASEDWRLRSVSGDFAIQLEAGQPYTGEQEETGTATPGACSEDGLAAIAERMQACPVSRNLPSAVEKRTTLRVLNGSEGDPQSEG